MQAVALYSKLAASDEFRLDWDLIPGDIQLLNNYTNLHARTAFTDWEVTSLRVWGLD